MSTAQAEAGLETRPKVVVAPVCDYCGEDAVLRDKNNRKHDGLVWACSPCRAWVGVHANSPVHAPLGRLANHELRAKRVKALYYFDQVWKSMAERRGWTSSQARGMAYAWLAREMSIPLQYCNIYGFDEDETQVVIDICSAVGGKKDVAA
jgi:hypothetical protein